MTAGHAILLANAASSLALFGLIWTIQLVHYPTFRFVDPGQFVAFEAFHQRQITLVVAPLMLIELGTALALVWLRPAGLSPALVLFALGLVASIWLVTFTVQVPLHNRLAAGADGPAMDALVRTNWVRTVLWTLRAGIAGWMVWAILARGGGTS